eukprot:gb/GECH01005525.1/.p1 GENE.gb/GECH01005525.1/~~gb/GECH01005525.1/.p1  ORF type:complete len:294 (+),score=64.98 gb/GECH01005525.1/:1-882(+)
MSWKESLPKTQINLKRSMVWVQPVFTISQEARLIQSPKLSPFSSLPFIQFSVNMPLHCQQAMTDSEWQKNLFVQPQQRTLLDPMYRTVITSNFTMTWNNTDAIIKIPRTEQQLETIFSEGLRLIWRDPLANAEYKISGETQVALRTVEIIDIDHWFFKFTSIENNNNNNNYKVFNNVNEINSNQQNPVQNISLTLNVVLEPSEDNSLVCHYAENQNGNRYITPLEIDSSTLADNTTTQVNCIDVPLGRSGGLSIAINYGDINIFGPRNDNEDDEIVIISIPAAIVIINPGNIN